MRLLLTAAGFTDIVDNEDGTVSATKDGIRYSKMYLSDWDMKQSTDAVTQNVTMTYVK